MRQVLFRIPWDGFDLAGIHVPLFGWGLLLLLWGLTIAWTFYQMYGRRPAPGQLSLDPATVVMWLALGALILKAPELGPRLAPTGLPIFGYGVMLLCGLISAIALAEVRAQRMGLPAETIMDLALWLIFPGIIGARLFYLIQYRERVYAGTTSLGDAIFRTINLAEGGIVLYGALLAGAASYFTFCYRRRLAPLQLADVITPSVFVGIGFGRLGCLLNGCCYGDYCSLPWGIQFPQGSGPATALVLRGFLPPDAGATFPLHPTQIYSALDGFLIAILCLWYTPVRRVPGDVFGLAILIYPATRFLIEFVRGDEFGQWGTTLTISQWISGAVFLAGLAFQIDLSRRAARHRNSVPAPDGGRRTHMTDTANNTRAPSVAS